jgi:hypothetical protein
MAEDEDARLRPTWHSHHRDHNGMRSYSDINYQFIRDEVGYVAEIMAVSVETDYVVCLSRWLLPERLATQVPRNPRRSNPANAPRRLAASAMLPWDALKSRTTSL